MQARQWDKLGVATSMLRVLRCQCRYRVQSWSSVLVRWLCSLVREAGEETTSFNLLSHVQLFATLWTAACQASLSFTISRSLLRLMFIKSVMPSNHLILCCPLLLLPSIIPSIRVFPVSLNFASSGRSIGISASASVLPMNIQDWFPLEWTG